ncbi:UDP-N-acetylmuramoyl-L-alanine--D-glutamate ligase, partial [Persephonella sp.]
YSIKNFKPDIAVFLNFYPDHLDWHKKLSHYKLSKYRLFKNMKETDPAVLNFDDKTVKNTPKKGKRYYFSLVDLPKDLEGAYFNGSEIILRINKNKLKFNLSSIQLKGTHNIQNLMAAVITAYLYGISPDLIAEKLKSFIPLPHRMEYVGKIDEVDFYNDSKATTIQAVKKALQSFPDRKVILITGGINKGGDFSDLRDELKFRVKHVFIIGRDKMEIFKKIKNYTTAELKDSLEDAVNSAFRVAEKKDVILLSPGCASFDMFKNYQERGERFKEIVRKLGNG